MRQITNAIIRIRNLLVHEFPLLLSVAVAAYTTVTDHSIKGYVVAVGLALLRFVVSPAFQAMAVKEKAISPKLIAAIQAVLAAQVAESPDLVATVPETPNA